MNAKTTLSAKGQVVIPKDVRDSLGLRPGQTLDVVQTGGGVFLRPEQSKSGRSNAEILASIRKITSRYKGPPVGIEELNEAIAEGWSRGMHRDDW